MKKILLLTMCVGLCVSAAAAQNADAIRTGAWELGVWTEGGFSVPGGTKDTQIMNAGFRAGKVLTPEIGPGLLRGKFEYAVDVVPVYVVFQKTTVYGAGFNPVVFKWNFTHGNRRMVPFFELAGGTLFSQSDVPAGTNTVNFTTQVALGAQVFQRSKRSINFSVRYMHISNAGLASPNPGINTVQMQLGLHWWK